LAETSARATRDQLNLTLHDEQGNPCLNTGMRTKNSHQTATTAPTLDNTRKNMWT